MTKVLLTGASGYIALHILENLLLDSDNFKVVATVRTQPKADFVLENMKKLHPEIDFPNKLTFEIVPDINIKNSFDEVVKKHQDLEFVLHTASPYTYQVKDPTKELHDPAVNGILNVLNAVKKYGPNVKHVTETSSLAAVVDLDLIREKDHIWTEESWNPMTWDKAVNIPNHAIHYFASKTCAERATWEFNKNEKPNFTISSVNPSYAWGPQLFDATLKYKPINQSMLEFHSLLVLDPKATDPIDSPVTGPYFYYIDVRDVAKHQVASIKRHDISKNNRWLLIADFISGQDLVDYFHKTFPEYASKYVGFGKPGSGKDVRNQIPKWNAEKTLEQSKVKLIDPKKTLYDAAKNN